MDVSEDIPIFINVRDRLTDLLLLIDWLEWAGHRRITLLDNDSTWPPLVKYLKGTPHEVVRLGRNLGSRAIWHADLVPDEWFVYTDPDIVPTKECPKDAVYYLAELAFRYRCKAALGLKIDDVKDLPSRSIEEGWVAKHRLVEPGVYRSYSDTTFAVNLPGHPFTFNALRTAKPYQARHLPWYRTKLDSEHRYYLDHAMRGDEGTTWEA